MICDVCKKSVATVFFTQIVAGKLQKVNLCEACSKQNGLTDPVGFSLADNSVDGRVDLTRKTEEVPGES